MYRQIAGARNADVRRWRAQLRRCKNQVFHNLPSNADESGKDWGYFPSCCLDSLFGISPPTALILDRACEYIAAQQHLALKGIHVPRDVSLICTDDDFTFEWCEPTASCVRWDSRPWVRRIVQWVNHVPGDKDDRRKSFTQAKFVERGSIGPAPDGKQKKFIRS